MSLLTTAKLVFDVGAKIVELHEAGVDKQIVERIHHAFNEVKSVVDDHHHKMRIKKGESDVQEN